MDSIISMPATVVLASLPSSRICTRVMFVRLFETTRATAALMTVVARPTTVRTTL